MSKCYEDHGQAEFEYRYQREQIRKLNEDIVLYKQYLQEIAALVMDAPELNMLNYDEEQVSRLNDNMNQIASKLVEIETHGLFCYADG